MKKYFVCQQDFGHKIWSVLPIIARVMYRVGCLFDKSAHLFVDLPAMKAILNGIQADLSFTPQISFADSSTFSKRYAWMYSSQEYSGSG